MRPLVIRAVVACVLMLLTIGCGSRPEPAQHPEGDRSFVGMLRTTHFTSIPYDSPREMLRSVDIALVGTIQDLREGFVEDAPEDRGVILIGIRPSEQWKGHPETKEGLVYVAVSRPSNVGLEHYRELVEPGTNLVVFGVHHPPSTTFVSGDPGVRVYVPDSQGFFFPGDDGRLVNVWAENAADADWAGIDNLADLRRAALSR